MTMLKLNSFILYMSYVWSINSIKNIRDPFARWGNLLISEASIHCTIEYIKSYRLSKKYTYGVFTVRYDSRTLKWKVHIENVLNTTTKMKIISQRLQDLRLGFIQALEYGRDKHIFSNFKTFRGIIMDNDDAEFSQPWDSYCSHPHQHQQEHQQQQQKRYTIYRNNSSHNNSSKESNNHIPWAPIFAQNRLNSKDNLYVLIPDFSYFSLFQTDNDHGNEQDVWFTTVQNEITNMNNNKNTSTYYPIPYEFKQYDTAVWRGNANIQLRDWGRWRNQLIKCTKKDKNKFLNTTGIIQSYLSKADMCRYFKIIITIPGNGIWSWSTKFNMLCNSVTMLINLHELNGETWETREELGLIEGQHYVGISRNIHTLCTEIKNKVIWVRQNPKLARKMAYAMRSIVLEKLNRDAVLRDFATLLFDYSELYVA